MEIAQGIPLQGRWMQARSRLLSRIHGLLRARFFGRPQAASERALHMEDRLTLGPKKTLYLVRCREQEFLVASSGDAVLSLLEVSSGSEKASPARMRKCERRS